MLAAAVVVLAVGWIAGLTLAAFDAARDTARPPAPRRGRSLVGVKIRRLVGPLRCARCGVRLTNGDPGHPDYGPADLATPGCVCERFATRLLSQGGS